MAIEFYESQNDPKFMDYQSRMDTLLADPIILTKMNPKNSTNTTPSPFVPPKIETPKEPEQFRNFNMTYFKYQKKIKNLKMQKLRLMLIQPTKK